MLECLVTSRWLLFGVVVELLEGEASLEKAGCWEEALEAYIPASLLHALLLHLLYMKTSRPVSNHHGWSHTTTMPSPLYELTS